MATKQQDEYLKTVLGVDPARHRGKAPASGAAASLAKSHTSPSPSTAAPAPGGSSPANPAPAPTPSPAKPAKPGAMVITQPADLVKLKAGLDGVEGAVQDGLKREQEIAAAGKKEGVDPSKTDGIARAGARLAAVITPDERARLKNGESQIKKSQQSVTETLERIDESRDHLVNFKELKLEEVHTEDAREKAGKKVSEFYDFLVNAGKFVIDLVTGDMARFAGWIVAQANLELAGADVIKDGIEALVDGIEENQKEIENGLNEVVKQLNDFRHKEIEALIKTLSNLCNDLIKRLELLQEDAKEMGVELGQIARAHKGDAGDFRPLMSVYQKISEANTVLSKVAIAAGQNAALADKKWQRLLLPLGTLDDKSMLAGDKGTSAVSVVYSKGGAPHVFLIKTSSATFASSYDAGPAAIEKLADAYKTLQDALKAHDRVKPLADQWSKALSTGMDHPSKH